MDWLLIALIAPVLWAFVSVIDNFFVESVYKDELDGIVISALFQLAPWLLVPLGILQFSSFESTSVWAIGSGFFFLASLFQYFRSLFLVNDSALMQILWSLSVPLVPFFAFFFVNETLSLSHYLGIAVAFVGVLIFNFDIEPGAGKRLRRVAIPMAWAVVCMALSMVFGKKAFIVSSNIETNFLLFCLGGVFILLLVPLFDRMTLVKRFTQTRDLMRGHFIVFSLAEGLSVMATFSSQWAIKLAPAISFVALIESLTPVFVVLVSIGVILSIRFFGNHTLEKIYREQIVHMRVKILATVIIATGVFLIS